MRRRRVPAYALVALLAPLAASAAAPQQTAGALLDRLQAGDLTAVEARFTPAIAQAVPPEKLAEPGAGCPRNWARCSSAARPANASSKGSP